MPTANWFLSGSIGNIPVKDDGNYIRGTLNEQDTGKITLLNYKDDFHNEISGSRIICEFIVDERWTKEGLADAIATALTGARDIGFGQGRQHIRKALGL